MGSKVLLVHLIFIVSLLSLLFIVNCDLDMSEAEATSELVEPFPTSKCESTLRGCECDDYDELAGISCTNVTDFRPYAHFLFNGSIFEENTTYEISLAGLTTLFPRSIEGLIVYKLIIDDQEFDTIDERVFDGVYRLREFHVRKSSLTKIPDFRKIRHSLRRINVDHSRLKELSGEYLQNLTIVEYLSFSDNQIRKVDPDVFLLTDAVVVFDLSQNELEFLPEKLFDPWIKLTKVVLTRNRLVHVNKLFAVAQPQFIYLDFNNLTDVDAILYPNMTNMETFLIASNPITKISEKSFNHKVPNIRFLYLDHCHIEEFDVRHYEKLDKLTNIDLSYNRIRRIGEQKVAMGYKLEIDLIGNQIVEFEAELSFQVIRLYLSNNQMEVLGKTLQFMQMSEVSVAYNRLLHLRVEDLHGSHGLKNLELQGNRISWVDRDTFVGFRNDLHNLDLSANRMPSLNGSITFLSQLKSLNVSNNLISVFNEMEFIGLSELSELYLQNNRILALGGLLDQLLRLQYLIISNNDITSLRVGQVPKTLQFLYFKNNPFVCDCKMLPFLKWINSPSAPVTDISICSPPTTTNVAIKFQHPSLDCPPQCDCYCNIDDGLHYMMIDCNGRNMSIPPSFLSREYWLNPLEDSSVVLVQHPRNLIVRQNVDQRFLIQDRVMGLDMENNSFSSLERWSMPNDIRHFYVANNLLKTIPETTLQLFNKLKNMTLSGNRWTCDCDTAPLKKWLLSRMGMVQDVNVTRCYSSKDSSLNGRVIVSLSDLDICPPDIAFYTALAFGVLCFLLFCAGIKITYTRYEMNIKVWLYSHGVTWVKEKDIDKDKPFDAFISFSHQDESLVDEIVGVLEIRVPKIKLCLHSRNFEVGEFIHENIFNAVKNSKRTVLVLSRHFLESQWCLMEFRAAHVQGIEDRVPRIIVIKLGDLPQEIDPAIKVYLESTTYVEWGEKYFWQKLLYALPTSKNNVEVPLERVTHKMAVPV